MWDKITYPFLNSSGASDNDVSFVCVKPLPQQNCWLIASWTTGNSVNFESKYDSRWWNTSLFKLAAILFIPQLAGLIKYSDVIMGAMASQTTSLTVVYSTVYSGADQRKHQSSASLAFVRRIHRWPVNSAHKWPVTRKMFPFDDVIMYLFTVGRYHGPYHWTCRRYSAGHINCHYRHRCHLQIQEKTVSWYNLIPVY